jgi:hypothetical protein
LVAQITGLDEKTIRRGQAEVAGSLADIPIKRQRRAGGGRPPVEKTYGGKLDWRSAASIWAR